MSDDQLSKSISTIIRNTGRRATRVVERYVADTETGVALPLTVPLVGWGMFRALSSDERIVWLAWALVLYLIWRVVDVRRRERELES